MIQPVLLQLVGDPENEWWICHEEKEGQPSICESLGASSLEDAQRRFQEIVQMDERYERARRAVEEAFRDQGTGGGA